MWTREWLRTTGNPASGQSGTRTREPYCESNALTTRPAWGLGGGGALFWSLPRVCLCLGASWPVLVPLKRLAFVTRKLAKLEVEACGFLFFSGGRGVGSKRYVCMYAVAGEPSKEGTCYRAWEWSVWECTPVPYSKVYFLTKVLHSCSHCKKRNSNTDDNHYLDEYSKPTIIWKCWLDNLWQIKGEYWILNEYFKNVQMTEGMNDWMNWYATTSHKTESCLFGLITVTRLLPLT